MCERPMRFHDDETAVSGAHVVVPAMLLPCQYIDCVRRRLDLHGPHRLMVAVLEDAVDVFRKRAGARDRGGRALFRETEEWFESRDQSWVFAFESICAVLDLEPDSLRRGLQAWKRRATETRERDGARPQAAAPRRRSGEKIAAA